MNKLEFSSLIDCFVYISEATVCIGVVWFSVYRFSSFGCISYYCFYREKIYLYIRITRERKMSLSKVNKEKM
jgi:hypothetical protein